MSAHRLSSTGSTRSSVKDRNWFVDLQLTKAERSMSALTPTYHRIDSGEKSMKTLDGGNLLPVGWTDENIIDNVQETDDDRLLAKRSWDIACQPLKQLPMNLILAWMAGNSFSLMSIMIVGMLFMKPIQSIFSLKSAFGSLEQEDATGNIWLLKLIYLLGNLIHLGLALYKCQSMGLLPTYNSDWIAFVDQQNQAEATFVASAYSL